MKLTQDSLPNYFTIADSTSSWYKEPTNTFNFVDQSSDTLVVTAGDSWTWGCDLTPNNQDDSYRIQNVYGNLVADAVGADWLNLALPATGNFWLADMMVELANVIPQLTYKKIYVICTFTETGRWFNTKYDLDIDYLSWIRSNINIKQDFNLLLAMFNHRCVTKIQTALNKFDHVRLLIGTNMVEHIGFDTLNINNYLSKPWYQVMGYSDNNTTYVVVDGIKSLLQLPDFLNDHQTRLFKEWMIDLIPLADERFKLMETADKFNNYHPTAAGHREWANYIIENL